MPKIYALENASHITNNEKITYFNWEKSRGKIDLTALLHY